MTDTSPRQRIGNALSTVWGQDAIKLTALVGVLFALYIAGGFLLDFGVRQQINSLSQLLFYIAVFAMLALALNLHWGYTGLFNIGVIGFMAVGIYTTAILSKGAMMAEPAAGSTGGFGLPLWLGIIGGVVAAGIFGAFVALPALRLRADYFAIVTVGLSEIVRFTLLESSFQQTQLFGYFTGLGGGSGLILDFDPTDRFLSGLGLMDWYVGAVERFGTQFGLGSNPKPVIDTLLWALILLVFLVGFYVLLQRVGNSPFGRVLKAIREDEDATRSLGKNTDMFKIKAFTVGCALMGLAGILFYAEQGAITPDAFRPRITFFVWIALIIGGAGSNTGSVMGGALFAAFLFRGPIFLKNIIEEQIQVSAVDTFGEAVVPLFTSIDPVPLFVYTVDNMQQLQLVFMGLVLIYLMHNRPDGVLGHRKEAASSIPLARVRGGASADAAGADAADETAPVEGGEDDG
ncbi:branched-chain amino acid ABC transporter permease [Natronomonas salina]|uniref:branched-chain amino acid ABC transporter permease n=1 Tax=Natronomonas salina TaxID=1710540 RepID=UPI0015B5A379|nr:branched-chain amino acid ABC transporter permease [Natronomonas salina]QLD91124.1 branched-chain amino acid ABC transporter permease [Natronomonas salina]